MIDLLADPPSRGVLPVATIAQHAGVSEPTVYRYFPNREVLLQAVDEFFHQEVRPPPVLDDLDDLAATTFAACLYFGRRARWVRASLANEAASEFRAIGRKRRVEQIRAAVAAAVAHLEPSQRELAFAAFTLTIRLESWDYVTRTLGLDDEAAGQVGAFIVQALADALRSNRRARRKTLVERATIERGRQLFDLGEPPPKPPRKTR